MDNKIGIVILNYLNWQDTLECLESLKQQTNQNFQVVVVDNGSKNESSKKIDEMCNNIDNFYLISLKNNLGFANGNNVGIHYLKKTHSLTRILIVNNDVIFNDVNYIEKLSKLSYDNTIGAIGTKIIGLDGLNQNPAYFPISYKSTIKSLLINAMAFSRILTCIKKKFFSEIAKKANDFSSEKYKNQRYFLHGSAIFLTENYLNLCDGFYGGTFLYYEEVILGVVFEKMKLEMLYVPEFSIYHKEDQSSLQSFNNNDLVRRRFLIQSILSSFKVYHSSADKVVEIVNQSIILE